MKIIVPTPRFDSRYDPGKKDREFPEDGKLYIHPFFVIIDGYSIAFNPYSENSPRLFNGFTSGQLVRNLIMKRVCLARPDQSLESLAIRINEEIGKTMSTIHGISLNDAGLLPGASVILGKICEDHVELIHAGDCYAIWLHEPDEIGITENKYYTYDRQAIANLALLKTQHQEDEKTIWEKHIPFLAEMRRKHANTQFGYPIINGQPEVENCWQKREIPLEGLKLLLLLTDGCIPSKQMRGERKLAKNTIDLYQSGRLPAMTGLARIIHAARKIESSNVKTSHEKHAEATGMALTFS